MARLEAGRKYDYARRGDASSEPVVATQRPQRIRLRGRFLFARGICRATLGLASPARVAMGGLVSDDLPCWQLRPRPLGNRNLAYLPAAGAAPDHSKCRDHP